MKLMFSLHSSFFFLHICFMSFNIMYSQNANLRTYAQAINNAEWDITSIKKINPNPSPISVPLCRSRMVVAYFEWQTYVGPFSLNLLELSSPAFEANRIVGPNQGGFMDGTGSIAEFNGPTGLDFSPDCSWLAVADTSNNRIRRVEVSTGMVSTVAGGESGGYIDGRGTLALFNYPISVAISPDGGSIFVSDSNNNAIRKIQVGNHLVTTLAGGSRERGSPISGSFLDGAMREIG